MLSDSRLRVAVVGGGGLVGQRHCQHVMKSPETELVSIVDPSPMAQDAARALHTAWCPDIETLLAGPHRPDAAIVCTPNHAHVAVSIRLAHAGIHILCEKPISHDTASARSLIQEVETSDASLLIGHHRRFNSYVLAMKQVVDSGRLGHITAVNGLWTSAKPDGYFAGKTAHWRSQRSSGGGVIMINFIHEIDLMHFLFGPTTRAHAEKTLSRRTSGPGAVEEGAALTLRFTSGVVGTFIISDNVASPHSFEQGTGENPALPKSGADVYRIFGTTGSLSFPDMKLWSYGGRQPSWEMAIDCEELPVTDVDIPPFDRQLAHFVDVCRGRMRPGCTGEDGLRALAVCEAISKVLDSETGGGTVEIDGAK